MPRATDTRTRLLDAAERLVLQHGFGSTTIDGVLADAKSSKGAFFHHFPSKAALGRALVERYAAADAELLESLMAAAEGESDDPADQLIAFVAGFERTAETLPELQPGCLFVSFIYESDLAGSGVDDVVSESVLLWRGRILDKLERAAARHRPLAPVDLPSLADQVFTTFEGGFLLARALDDPAALRRQIAHLRHYLELLFDRLPAPAAR